MRPFVTLALLVASASAASYGNYGASVIRVAPQAASYADNSYGSTVLVKQIPITSFNQNIRGSQENDVTFTTGNGISVTDNTQSVSRPGSYEENGRIIQTDSSLLKTGSFSYTSDDGQQISLSYNADDNGFRASGSHLPVAPLPVEKTPEVLQAEQEHFALVREAQAKLASLPSYSDDSGAYAVRSNSYAAPAVVRSNSYAAPAVVRATSYAAPAVVRTSSYAAPTVVRVEPTQVVIRSNGY